MRHRGRYNHHHNPKIVVSMNVVLMQKHGTKACDSTDESKNSAGQCDFFSVCHKSKEKGELLFLHSHPKPSELLPRVLESGSQFWTLADFATMDDNQSGPG